MSANYYFDIGAQLRKIRLEQKREIKDIAQSSRISDKYIEAIEAGDIKAFPSTVYYNLFARAYARELGIDPDKIFVISSEETIELEKVEELGDSFSAQELRGLDVQVDEKEKSSGTAFFWFAGIFIVIVAAVLIYYFGNYGDEEGSSGAIVSSTEIQDTVSLPVASDEPVYPKPQAAEDTNRITPVVTEKPKEPPVKRDTVVKQVQQTVPSGDQMTLSFDIIDSSWVLVIADGDTALNRSLYAGATRTIRANQTLVISAYNPSGINFKLNDREMRPISPLGRPVRNVVIDRSNMESYYRESAGGGAGE